MLTYGGMPVDSAIGHHKAPSTTLVTLEQAIAPRVTPPGPMQGLVRGLCGRVLQNMMADLKTELTRRQAAGNEEGLERRYIRLH